MLDKSAKSEPSLVLSDSSVGKSSSSNNKFSNKEFVYGDSDDEETLVDSKESLKNSEMFEPLSDEQSESASEDVDDLNLENLSENELIDLIETINEEEAHLQRNQRANPRQHQMQDGFVEKLSKMSKNSKPKKEPESSGEDYDELMNSLFKMNTDQFETDMKAKEIGGPIKPSGKSSGKPKLPANDDLSSLLAMLGGGGGGLGGGGGGSPKGGGSGGGGMSMGSLLGSLGGLGGGLGGKSSQGGKGSQGGEKSSGGMGGLGNLENLLKSLGGLGDTSMGMPKMSPKLPNKEPTNNKKPVFDFKEKIYSENDYNKQFKSSSSVAAAAILAKESSSDSGDSSFEKSSNKPTCFRCCCVLFYRCFDPLNCIINDCCF